MQEAAAQHIQRPKAAPGGKPVRRARGGEDDSKEGTSTPQGRYCAKLGNSGPSRAGETESRAGVGRAEAPLPRENVTQTRQRRTCVIEIRGVARMPKRPAKKGDRE